MIGHEDGVVSGDVGQQDSESSEVRGCVVGQRNRSDESSTSLISA